MKRTFAFYDSKSFFTILILGFSIASFAQMRTSAPLPTKSNFWKNVQFGGGFGLGIGSGFTDINLAPSAIYNFNEYFSTGIGLQGSYVALKNNYTSAIYGASLISLFNPIDAVQLSAELEQVRVNRTIEQVGGNNLKDNFWNTGLFVGAGYRSGNVTLGARYNVLYNKNSFVYSSAFMPFIRVFF